LVDSVRVEVYGSATPLKQLASIGAPEPSQLVIRPYDASTIKDIEKAIVASDLGLNPQSDGKIIRINIPALSTDVRKKLVARIKELTEEAKIAVRAIRRDANKLIETAEKDKEIGEDDCNKLKDEVQELTKKYEATASDLAKARETDVMEA
jgi:ribosome recycling factor